MAEEFRLWHYFEPSFPDAPPPRAPRDLRSKTRAPLVRLTPNFMGIHPTAPNDEWQKNFASGTILSRVFPTPHPLAHPRDLRSKIRAPGVRGDGQRGSAPPGRRNGGEGAAAVERGGPRRRTAEWWGGARGAVGRGGPWKRGGVRAARTTEW
ncbi:hypothetical protein niasHT_012728 [Heterodera trifolii]|uniref:Uncharacterized protein n=1 Tax=Heterodera trifolii TaxID=157864 RepID=A0ABD2L7Y1_9BILA